MKPSLSFSASLRLCASLLLASSLHAQFAPVKINATNGALFAPGFTAAQILASNNVPTNGAPLTNFSGTLPWANISGQPSFNLVATNTNATILTNGSSITNLSGLPDTVTNVANYVTNGTLTNVSNALSLQIGTNATNLFTLSNSLVSATNTLQAGITSNATVITSVSNSLTNYTPSSGLNTVAKNTNATIPTNGGTGYTLGLGSNSTFPATLQSGSGLSNAVISGTNPDIELFTTFGGDSEGWGANSTTLMFVWTPDYGTTLETNHLAPWGTNFVRDPSPFYTNAFGPNGAVLIAATAGFFAPVTNFNLLITTDLQTASLLKSVASPYSTNTSTLWAPTWNTDSNGSPYITAIISPTIGTNGYANNLQLYETHPTDATMTNWSTWTNISLPGSFTNFGNTCITYIGGTYNCIVQGGPTNGQPLGLWTATNKYGPYTYQSNWYTNSGLSNMIALGSNGTYIDSFSLAKTATGYRAHAWSGNYIVAADSTNNLTNFGTPFIIGSTNKTNGTIFNNGWMCKIPATMVSHAAGNFVTPGSAQIGGNANINGSLTLGASPAATNDTALMTRITTDLEPITGYTTIELPVATASTSASGGVTASVDNAGFITFGGASTSPVGSYGMVNITRPEQTYLSCLNRIARKWITSCGTDPTNNNATAYFIGGNPSGGSNPVLTSDGLAASWSLSGVVVLQAKINGSSVQSVTNTNSIIGQSLDPGTDYTLTWNGTNTLQLWVARYAAQNYVRPAVIATLITTNNAGADQLSDGADHVIKYFTATNSSGIYDRLGNFRSFFY